MSAGNDRFEYMIDISFGDCDPARIVFYPNFFYWFDTTYHWFLESRGIDHTTMCEKLGTIGTGAIDVGATFKSAVRAGDRLRIVLEVEAWSEKTFRLGYKGYRDDELIVEGYEVRGLFVQTDASERLRAGPIAPFRALLEAGKANR